MDTTRRLWLGLGALLLASFGVLLFMGSEIHRQAPPMPEAVVTTQGDTLFTRADIENGRRVWQSIGGMQLGSIWGHGALVAPDWSADWLHREATAMLDLLAHDEGLPAFDTLDAAKRAELTARMQRELARPLEDVPMLFEAAFEHENVMVRGDGFHRRHDGDTLIEVKSSTSVKDEYLWDCAIQTWVARGAGRNVDRILLAHVNNQFVYEREGDYEGLLVQVDITAEVQALLPSIPDIVKSLAAVASGPVPDITTGPQCTTPYGCPCFEYCRASEPPAPDFPIDTLPRAGRLADELREEGFDDVRDVPLERLQRPLHQRVAEASRTGEVYASPDLEQRLAAIPYRSF